MEVPISSTNMNVFHLVPVGLNLNSVQMDTFMF